MNTNKISELLSSKFGKDCVILASTPVHGGDINVCKKLTTNLGAFFIKLNQGDRFPGMFRKEALGLETLATSSFNVPKVIHTENNFLMLEWVEKETPTTDFWTQFGQSLAKMHQIANDQFGFDEDNFIGSLNQSNAYKNDWTSFFVENRIEPQVKLAVDDRKLHSNFAHQFERFYNKVGSWLPPEKPALVHGDLWSGNIMCTTGNTPTIFDPAAYYGHREMDLAMTKLFGGFSSIMYKSYQEIYPLELGFEERIDIYNLYPLLVHVNLFGGSYVRQVEKILGQYN